MEVRVLHDMLLYKKPGDRNSKWLILVDSNNRQGTQRSFSPSSSKAWYTKSLEIKVECSRDDDVVEIIMRKCLPFPGKEVTSIPT